MSGKWGRGQDVGKQGLVQKIGMHALQQPLRVRTLLPCEF